jgi:integrase/recombinase XerD
MAPVLPRTGDLAPASQSVGRLGEVSPPEETHIDSLVLVAEWRRWMEATGLSPETQRTYSYAVIRFMAENPRPVENYSEGHVIEFLASLGKRAAARQSYVRALHSFFGWLKARDYITADPATLIRPKKAPEKDADCFTPDEVASLALVAYLKSPRRAAAILLTYGLGARRGEICALRPEDVDFERETVYFAFTKGNRPRTVYMSRIARQALEELKPYWTETVLGGIEPNTLNAWVHEAAVALGLPEGRRNAHMLRASYATHLLNRGVPIHVVSKLLGHSDVKVTTRYAVVVEEQKRAGAAVL